MKRNSRAIELSFYLTKKFGFISRNVFWDLVAPKGRTARYQYWRDLQNSPLYRRYGTSESSAQFLVFSAKGKAVVGTDVVSESEFSYLTHDEFVMRFCILLKERIGLSKIWSEGELKKDRSLAIKTLGDGRVSKLPDLVFDFPIQNSFIRIVLEVERTRKSKGRYESMSRAYQRALYTDVLIFGVNDDGIQAAIESEFGDGSREFHGKQIGFFSLSDFLANAFEAKIQVSGKELSLQKYFDQLGSDVPYIPDFERHVVRESLREVS